MHLLRIEDNGDFSLVERQGQDIPPYAILSHTWFKDEEEVNFQDVNNRVGYRSKVGYCKLQFCAQQAATDNLRYIWVDTCCIDKTSSAELAEAINSMFRWYQSAVICYVYLSDVPIEQYAKSNEPFRNSRWFTRGWTLQELIAPASVEFFSLEGKRLGDKQSMVNTIHEITGIPKPALRGQPLSMYTADERMSWANGRSTKREEDAAYSLLGLFNIYMPPIYGEGREHAFVRLRKEIGGDPKTLGLSNLDNILSTDAKTLERVPKNLDYRIPFSLKGVPLAKYADRPRDTEAMARFLLPIQGDIRRRMLVIHGLGGAGKTQLAADFARCHQHNFSSVFWLDGSSKNSLKQAIANCANRIAPGQISERSRMYALEQGEVLDTVIKDVLRWLSLPANGQWLFIVDNMDRDHRSGDPEAYDIEEFLPDADHGSVLITTRLLHLGQLGEQWEVKRVDKEQARLIFEVWFGRKVGENGDNLLELLDGLPLALAQAAAYMNEVGINPTEYTRLYQRRWRELMDAQNEQYLPLRRYVNGTVATTWIISYTAIREKNEYAANLLLLWAHLDHRSLWYELISSGSGLSSTAAALGLTWLRDLAQSEIEFIKAIGLLRSYSLVEEMTDQTGYATHPVVHQWAYNIQTDEQKTSLSRLAIMLVGFAIPRRTEKGYCATQIRLLPHADCCKKQLDRGLINVSDKTGDVTTAYTLGQHSGHLGAPELVFERDLLYHAVKCIGNLYAEWDNLEAAEKLYVWTLTGQEDTVGREDMWTLATAYSLGSIYTTQGKLDMADKMFQRVMQGRERTYGKDDLRTLNAVSALASLHGLRGNLDTAERLYIRALEGFKTAVGPKHEQTLFILYNLGGLYRDRGKLDDAEIMCKQALDGWTESFGLYHPYTLDSLTLLANLYMNTRRAAEAEKICIQVLEGYKRIRGSEHSSTLKAVHCLGSLYSIQGKLEEAEKQYKQALNGFERLLGPSPVCTFNPALDVMFDMGELYYKRHRFSEARGYYTRALTGYENSSSDQHPRCGFIRKRLSVMDQQDNNQMLPQPLPSQLPSSPADSRGQEDQRARQTRVSRFSRLKKSLQLKR